MSRYINKTNRRIKCFLFFVTIGLILSWNSDAFSLLTPTGLSLKTERICRECHNLDIIIHFDKTQEDWALVLKSMLHLMIPLRII